MNKKIIAFIVLFVAFICPTLDVDALKPGEIPSNIECPIFEVAIAKADGGIQKVECYDDYYVAVEAMYNVPDDNAILIGNSVVMNAKYALVDYDADFTNAGTKYVKVYSTSTSNSEVGYIRTADNTTDDAVFLDYDINTGRAKIRVSGLTGWINKYDNSAVLYDIVPIVWAKTPQTYEVNDTTIYHRLPGNVYGEKGSYLMSIDVKPSMLAPGAYYSYDGHYFYNDIRVLINDYKANNFNNSVNNGNPYFNYYQYLSFRTQSNYNADNINQFLRSRISKSTSKMLNTGESFSWVQENYGVNAILMMSVGMNESGSGNSTFAQDRNNLFGLNAVDAAPGEASSYPTVDDCIKDYGYRWLSYWYLQPGDSHYTGANLGNKYEGLNVKYASDPYWGETAAHYYYELDKYYGFQDRDKNIAVLNSDYRDTVTARKTPGGDLIRIYNKNAFYQYKLYGTAVSIISEVTDASGNLWYKIQSEPVLDNNLNYVGESTSNPRVNYNWGSYVYVEAKYFIKVNVANIPQEQAPQSQPETPPIEEPTQPQTQTPTEVPIVPVSTIVGNANYRYENGIISGINLGTTVDLIVNTLASVGGLNISVIDANGTPRVGNLGTGDRVTLTSGPNTETLEVIIPGDTDGDGVMTAMDYVNIKNHIMELRALTGVYLRAADVDNDNNVSAVDYVNIKNYIMSQ